VAFRINKKFSTTIFQSQSQSVRVFKNFFHKFRDKITKITNFNLNEDLILNSDYDGLHYLKMSSFEDTWPMVGLISTSIASFSFKNITTPSILDQETEAPWEPLKIQLTLN